MVLDEKTYVLSENNYIKQETKKTQIVIGHTFNDQMKHFFGWKHRYNGKYKKTAAFTIDAAGFVYKHFEPKFKSDFFNSDDLNDKSIIILLENYGSLSKVVEKNQYIKIDAYKVRFRLIEVSFESAWYFYNLLQMRILCL